jgi:DNA gyrase subunit B
MSDALDHFNRRAAYYDRSSRWCTDPELAAATVAAVAPEPHHRMLDVACGTGLVARLFHGKVAHLTGLDLTPAMADQARPYLDDLVIGPAEHLPFPDATFDRVTCRQGIQFMDDRAAVAEMRRVLKPGGRLVLIHLVAYGEEDRAEYFEILRLRNPARRNFYLREDLLSLLSVFPHASLSTYITEEDVEAWADNRAVEGEAVRGIRRVYEQGSAAFLRLHGVRMEGERIVDRMLFAIAVGEIPDAPLGR